MDDIGRNIKLWRERRGMSQCDLAVLLEVSDKTISSWEINRTEPKIGMIEKLAAILNCKKTDLIGEDESTNEEHYYLDQQTKQVAEEIHKNKELSLLFYAAKDADPEDLKMVHDMLLRLKRTENN